MTALQRIVRRGSLMLFLGAFCVSPALSAQEKAVSHVEEAAGLSSESTLVKVGIWMIDIDSIDSAAQSYVASVFLRLTWQDSKLAHKDESVRVLNVNEVWSPEIQIVNEIGRVRKTLPEIVKIENDGTVTYRQRYVGEFSQPLKLHDFPFDEQQFRLHFMTTQGERELTFIPDDKLIEESIAQAAGISKDISLPDWTVLSYTAGPMPYEIVNGMQEAGYAFDFIVKRDSEYYVHKVIIPLILIVFMSWTVFWINPKESSTQIGVSTASMLTLIAYRFTIDLLVPKVSYLTRLDEFVLGSTFLVFLSLLQAILTSSLTHHDRENLALRIDQGCRVLFPVLFTFVLAGSFHLF